MNRGEVLDAAKQAVTHDRQSDHGRPEDTFQMICDMWNAFLSESAGVSKLLTPADVAMMMALLKIARFKQNPYHDDNYVDLAGYAACAAELASTPHLVHAGGY